jgi:hypothetical protein
MLYFVRLERELLVLVVIWISERIIGRDVEEVGFLGRVMSREDAGMRTKKELTYGRKRFFSAAICLSAIPKPFCAATEPGLACVISIVEICCWSEFGNEG